MKLSTRARSLGFALSELLLAIGVVSALIGGTALVYASMRTSNAADDTATAVLKLSADIQRVYGPSGSYAAVTHVNLNKMGLIRKPLWFDAGSAAVRDGYGSFVGVAGAQSGFVLILTSEARSLGPEECSRIAVRLAEAGAFQISVGSAAWATTGQDVGNGNMYRASGGAVDASALATGCAENGLNVAASFR